ncbi:MAG: DUF4345 domain-containing protein [Bacteroidota bacterium]
MDIFTIVILALSGLMLLFVGIMRLTNPIKTYAKNSGINLTKDVDLLNEIRGISAVMLCGGIIILLGIFLPSLRLTSQIVAILIFLGFVIGRLLSMRIDGKPNKQIGQGILFELFFSLTNIVGLGFALA